MLHSFIRISAILIALFLIAAAFFGAPSVTSAAPLDALCNVSPDSANVGAVFTVTCYGFTPNGYAYAYLVEPDGSAFAYGAVKADADGTVSFGIYTDFYSGTAKEKIGNWTVVVEETGLAKVVLVRGIAHYTIKGGTEGVSGAYLSADPSTVNKAEVAYTYYDIHISLPGFEQHGRLTGYNYSTTTVSGSGFAPGEIVTFWWDPPQGGCSNWTEHESYYNITKFPPILDVDAHFVLNYRRHPYGVEIFRNVKAASDGTVQLTLDFYHFDCEGVYHVVARGNTSGAGADTHLTLIGNPISESASLSASPNVVSALYDRVVFSGSGFAPGEHVTCWLTSPQGQTQAIPGERGFNGTRSEPPSFELYKDQQVKADSGGNFAFDLVTGSTYTKIDGTYIAFGTDISNTTFKEPYQSEGALGEWAGTCRGDTSGNTGIARFTVAGNMLDP